MAAVSNSRRSAAGILLLVAGALLLLDILLGFAGVNALDPWLVVLAYLAIGVAFILLAIGSIANLIARIALIVGGIGWLLLALGAAGVALPSPIGAVAAVAAAVGGLVGAIVLYTGKEITDRSAVAFIVTTIVAAIILLAGVFSIGLGVFGQILGIVFAIGLIITGWLFYRVQGRRGR
jgi:hypothetical protein